MKIPNLFDRSDDEDEKPAEHPSSVEEAIKDDEILKEAQEEAQEIIRNQEKAPTENFLAGDKPSGSSFNYVQSRLASVLREKTSWPTELEDTIVAANIKTPADLYLSKSILQGVLAGAAALLMFILATISLSVLEIPLLHPGILIAFSVTVSLSISIFVTMIHVGNASYKVFERKREINRILPDAISFMYTQSVGGVNHLDVIRSMAQSEDTYGQVAKEFQAIVREAEYFGEDYQAAIARQATVTPSPELSRFLTDFLTVLRSGGEVNTFLENETDIAYRTAEEEQETMLDLFELSAELYLVISLFPLMGLVVLVILSTIQPISLLPLVAIVYGLIPLVSIIFGVVISGIRVDDLGSAELQDSNRYLSVKNEYTQAAAKEETPVSQSGQQRTMSSSFGTDLTTSYNPETKKYTPQVTSHPAGAGVFKTPMLDQYDLTSETFSKIKSKEINNRIQSIFKSPLGYFLENPMSTLAITVPFVGIVMFVGLVSGFIPFPTPQNFMSTPLYTTIWWVHFPLITQLLPVAVFFEYNRRVQNNLFESFPEALRKVSSANDTGMTLLESIDSAVSEGGSRIDNELRMIHTKAQFGMPVEQALIEFNNKYKTPEIARTTRLIIEAQRTTQQISDVLQTAVRSAQNRIALNHEQQVRTGVQVMMVVITTVLILVIMLILDRIFLPIVAEGGLGSINDPQQAVQQGVLEDDAEFDSNLSPTVGAMMFLHAVTIHALFSGFLAGYIRTGHFLSGVKYTVSLLIVIAAAWHFI